MIQKKYVLKTMLIQQYKFASFPKEIELSFTSWATQKFSTFTKKIRFENKYLRFCQT